MPRMHHRRSRLVALLASALATALAAASLSAQPMPHHRPMPPSEAPSSAPATQPASAPAETREVGGDKVSVTDHEIALDGRALRYRATAGTLTLKDDAAKPRASMFFVAYDKTPGPGAPPLDPARRPITYVFNGGPGAAAVWLHLGALGPKRIDLLPDGRVPAPPYKLVDNPQTWLDLTDLVFIDPVGTGYSRPAPGEKAEQFFGVEQDLSTVAEFIRLYTTRYQRWSSPKFLAGESYGTTRAAALSEYLIDHTGIALNGIAFVSTVLDFSTLHVDEHNSIALALQLPTYAAVAWYHHKLPAQQQATQLPALVSEVKHWALTDYLAALAQGDRLDPATRQAVLSKLVQYTGLPPAAIEKTNLRVGPGFFEKNLLADQHLLLGRFDARITGFALDAESNWPDYDPALSQYYPVYTSTFNDYARRELKYDSDLTYEVLSSKVGWSFAQEGGGYLNVAPRLRSALAKNPHMRLLFAAGYFDLATPFATVDYTVDHLDLSPDLRRNITQTYYPGGHMLYHDHQALVQFKRDISAFLHSALSESPTSQPTTAPSEP